MSDTKTSRPALRPLGRTATPTRPQHHRELALQLVQDTMHLGDTVFVLAGVTAFIAIGIAVLVVFFGRRPGVSVTGQMLE